MRNGLEIDQYGTKRWYKNNLLHREDGPAIECIDGYKAYYINNMRHREDGPAVEYADKGGYYYLNGEYINISSDEEFKRIVKLKSFL